MARLWFRWADEIVKMADETSRDFVTLNTLRPRQDGRHLPDDIYQCIFLNENVWIARRISLKFVPKVRINNIPALVQIMAWRRPGDKPLSEPMMVSLLTPICVTRPQWVKTLLYLRNTTGIPPRIAFLLSKRDLELKRNKKRIFSISKIFHLPSGLSYCHMSVKNDTLVALLERFSWNLS